MAASICEHSATSIQHAPQQMRKSMPMIVAACSHLPRHRLSLISLAKTSFNTIAKSNLTDATETCAGAWGTGVQCVHGHNELGPSVHDKGHTGAQVCMCMGHWWPIVHVHVAPTSKCACAVGMFKPLTLDPKPKSPEPHTFDLQP